MCFCASVSVRKPPDFDNDTATKSCQVQRNEIDTQQTLIIKSENITASIPAFGIFFISIPQALLGQTEARGYEDWQS